ncbi:MAG: deoxyribose-phosphate aldolase [Provencibacterium sp.]|jgi:deoxyribose-phosphate aldolase|nr:deoxyribose-phosphate aldolase [Provencibacterium sp.]
MNRKQMAAMLDHTLLAADAQESQIEALCRQAAENGFASVCLNPCHVRRAAGLLDGSAVKVCTVIGFPLGACTTAVKAFEAQDAVKNGAQEIDMVMNIGALRSGDERAVYEDIRAVVEAAKPAIVKVILETCYLSDEQKRTACLLAKRAGARFVKTSTGFGPGGATAEDVRLMRETVGEEMGVKASGGIRTWEDACKMLQAGANRLGVSASLAILAGGDE